MSSSFPTGKGRTSGHRKYLSAATIEHGEPRRDDPLELRVHIHLIGGESGRALAAAQGRAVRDLLASLGHTEVGQGEEISP